MALKTSTSSIFLSYFDLLPIIPEAFDITGQEPLSAVL
jgi:hypothetical protein